jgi:hypothetical protein
MTGQKSSMETAFLERVAPVLARRTIRPSL